MECVQYFFLLTYGSLNDFHICLADLIPCHQAALPLALTCFTLAELQPLFLKRLGAPHQHRGISLHFNWHWIFGRLREAISFYLSTSRPFSGKRKALPRLSTTMHELVERECYFPLESKAFLEFIIGSH